MGAVGSAASLATACGAFSGEETSATDGGGSDSTSSVDAPAGRDGAAASGDAASATDAKAADASTSDGASTFCMTKAMDATFCADFDEPEATSNPPWDDTTGTFSITAAQSESAPFSLLAQAPTGSQDGTYLQKTFSVPSTIEVHYAVLFTSLPALSAAGRLCTLYIDSTNGPDFNFYADNGGSYFQSGNNIYSDDTMTGLTFGKWHEVDVKIDVTKNPAEVTTLLDGATVAWGNGGKLDQAYAALPANVSIYVGANHSYMLATPFSAYVDNVRVYVK
jgi:hypothetical protein